jgi:hypothetical protein
MKFGNWLIVNRGYTGEVVRLVMWLRLQNCRYWLPLLVILVLGSSLPPKNIKSIVWGVYGSATVGILAWAGYNKAKGGTWPQLSSPGYVHGPHWELPTIHRTEYEPPKVQPRDNSSSQSSSSRCWDCGGSGYHEIYHSNCTDEGNEEWIDRFTCGTCGGSGSLED